MLCSNDTEQSCKYSTAEAESKIVLGRNNKIGAEGVRSLAAVLPGAGLLSMQTLGLG